ncbi:MAG: mechanosensitive ion channel [Myxococcales bacterium]|nr:MAG: mechanosensitive ion channel [Myxococcales bacterium]
MGKIPSTFVSLLAAVFTIGLGIAARPVLENAIAGLVVSFSRSVSIGDTVEIHGFYGTVEDITVTHTTIKIWDWRRYVVPNSKMLQTEFVNLSLFDAYVWAVIDFWVSYTVDINVIEKCCLQIADRCPFRFPEGESSFWVADTELYGMRCRLAVWAKTPSDAWQVRSFLRQEVGAALQRMDAVPKLTFGLPPSRNVVEQGL